MIKAPVGLQDLRRKIYAKAKADVSWRFWGLYVHVCKMETLRTAFERAKDNDGAPGIDGVTFAAIEEQGVESFLEQIRDELTRRTYKPMRVRKREIPKDGGKKVRILSIPTIRDRVVQGALKLILEPIFEADFQSGSYGYRPKKTAHEAINRVAQAIVQRKTRVIDLDLRSYFDGVRHDVVLAKSLRLFSTPPNHFFFQLKNAVVLIYVWEAEFRRWSRSRKGCSNMMATAKSPVAFGCTRRTLPRTLDCVPVSGREATPNDTSTVEPSGTRKALESRMPPRLMFSERVCNSLSATLSETGRCRG